MMPKSLVIVSIVTGIISAGAAVFQAIDSAANGNKRARITGEACGQAYAITQEQIRQMNNQDNNEKKELQPLM